MKYNVGDTVRVRSDLKVQNYGSCSAVNAMVGKAGNTVTIKEVNSGYYKIEEDAWSWSDEMLEPLVFQNGDIITDYTGREFYFVGYGHDGKLVTEDQYDESFFLRHQNEDELTLKEETVTELTLAEVAKKFSIPVDKLRIRD